MEKQEFAFVVDTVAYDPWGQVTASMNNWGVQVVSFWVDDPLRRPMAFLKHEYWARPTSLACSGAPATAARSASSASPGSTSTSSPPSTTSSSCWRSGA